MPKLPRWPRWLLLGLVCAVTARILLKDMEMGWSRALQLYFFGILSVLFAMLFGLGRWLSARPSQDQVMARLGLATNVLTFELDEEGLAYGSDEKRPWSEFSRFSEDDRAFMLHGHEPLLQLIPKRAFSLEDMHRARALMYDSVTRR
ncbi:MAG: YcxB family protein [Polyangiales bacterium]